MRLALTGVEGMVGSALRAALSREHVITSIGDPRDEPAVRRALEQADAVVHLAVTDSLPSDTAKDGWQMDKERLDRATRGTFVLLRAAVDAGIHRIVLVSTLALLERYPAHWAVTEAWRPLPDVTDSRQLAAYLAEESAKQLARVEPLEVICLRLGEVVDDLSHRGKAYDPRWLHLDDAVQAVRRALAGTPVRRAEHASDRIPHGWWLYHISGGGAYVRFQLGPAKDEQGLGYTPRQTFAEHPGSGDWPPEPPNSELAARSALQPPVRVPSRTVRHVVVLGAGGPLAAAAAPFLATSYRLRLTDLRAIEEIESEARPQSEGAPLARVLGPPHESVPVDVTALDQVRRACEGMDAIVNCTVVRPHPVNAFLVNTIGAYHVMRAAVEHGIRRVVHTGPLQVLNDRQAGYAWDFGIPDEAPPRPGSWLYLHSKYLGQEIVRLFAEQYDLEAPALLFCNFAGTQPRRGALNPMTVSWEDAGRAVSRAVEAPSFPNPFESMHIMADLPHGKYSGEKAYRLLGWYPRDDLSHAWAHRPRPGTALP
jgi:nucleoside-diphosphate-sugar epimerase